jgi:undecaprenyl-diphosphatase
MKLSEIPPFAPGACGVARTEIAAIAALFVVAMGTFVFVKLANDIAGPGGRAFDQAVLLAVRPGGAADGWGPPWLETAAMDLTSLGGIAVLGLFGLIVVLFLILQRKPLSALLLVLGLAGGVGLSEGLKAMFGRDRPPEAWRAVEAVNASFPSGHALLAAVLYLSMGVILARAVPQRHLKVWVLGVAVLLTVIVGLTRVYLAAHWASDVLAGWSVGAAWAMTLWLAAYVMQHRRAASAPGPHDLPLPGSRVAAKDAPVIGE